MQPVLHLADGRQIAGEIRASDQAGSLRWQSAPLAAPREFAWKEVTAIQWPPPAAQPKPTGEFCFELAAGDVLFGSLLALDDRQAELDIPRLGRMRVQRSSLHRVDRRSDGADLIYLGPNGLIGWREPPGQTNWHDESGRPETNRESAAIRGDFGIPPRASIEFEISWNFNPDYRFALGVGDTDKSLKQAFAFEAWGGDLIITRETDTEADLAVVQSLTRGPGRSHFLVYLDQEKPTILVCSPVGKQLMSLKFGDRRPAPLSGLCLANMRGDVCLERLRIARWNGQIPRELPADQTRIHRTDGSVIDGQLIDLSAASKEFRFKTDKGELRVPENQFSSVLFANPHDDAPRMIRAVYQDGSKLSGDLVKVEDDAVTLKVPGIGEPLRLPIAGLRCLALVRH